MNGIVRRPRGPMERAPWRAARSRIRQPVSVYREAGGPLAGVKMMAMIRTPGRFGLCFALLWLATSVSLIAVVAARDPAGAGSAVCLGCLGRSLPIREFWPALVGFAVPMAGLGSLWLAWLEPKCKRFPWPGRLVALSASLPIAVHCWTAVFGYLDDRAAWTGLDGGHFSRTAGWRSAWAWPLSLDRLPCDAELLVIGLAAGAVTMEGLARLLRRMDKRPIKPASARQRG